MDTIIALAIILGIVGFLAYKNKDKLTALLDRARDDGLDADPEPATPYKVEPVAAPAAPAAAAVYNGEGDPPSQEAWAAWRKRQPRSSWAYIPEVWKPTDPVEPADPAHNQPKPFPASWDYSPKRVPVLLKAGVTYSMSFVDDGKKHQLLTTANVNIKRATPKIAFRNSEGVTEIPTRSQECNIQWGPGTRLKATPGVNSLEFTVPWDGGFTMIFKK